MHIMNRWGEVVFHSSDPLIGWDGTTSNGTAVADGTYFYIVNVQFEDKPEEKIHGFITVVR